MTVKTMEMEQPALLDAADAKQVQRKAAAATASGRKLVLASVGAGAYVLDGMMVVYQVGERLLNQAEKRGLTLQRTFRKRFGALEEQAVEELRKLQGQTEGGFEQVRASHKDANQEFERRIELALATMGLPSRDRIDKLNAEIDALNQKLDEQILRLPNEPLPDPLG